MLDVMFVEQKKILMLLTNFLLLRQQWSKNIMEQIHKKKKLKMWCRYILIKRTQVDENENERKCICARLT